MWLVGASSRWHGFVAAQFPIFVCFQKETSSILLDRYLLFCSTRLNLLEHIG